MKIIELKAENIKRLLAVEIRPGGNLVEITGRNGQGKTSVLDCIYWALAGQAAVQGKPIRNGENKASIRLNLGEIIVTRTFKAGKDGETTSSITVQSADGAKFPSPQTMLDDLLGELSFDPLAFARMEPRAQYDALRKFVPGVDFDAIEKQNQADYDKRREINRKANEARAAAEAITVSVNGPIEVQDAGALLERMEKATEHNSGIERRQENRRRATADATALEAKYKDLRAKAKELLELADTTEKQAQDIRDKLAKAPALPAPIDVSELSKQISSIGKTNEEIRERSRKLGLRVTADKLEQDAKGLTKSMEDREAEKAAKIAAAKMPVPGLSFGEGCVVLNGVPFDQASDAEQLRTSIAIAMALNPKLRVIRVRDGSLLDGDSMKLLAQMADAKDYQVWIERVDGSGTVGFVLEDGCVKGAPAPAEKPAATAAAKPKPAAAHGRKPTPADDF